GRVPAVAARGGGDDGGRGGIDGGGRPAPALAGGEGRRDGVRPRPVGRGGRGGTGLPRREGRFHHPRAVVLEPEQVAQFVGDHRGQVHSPRGAAGRPAPPGGGVVDPDLPRRRVAQLGPRQVRQADRHAGQGGQRPRVGARG